MASVTVNSPQPDVIPLSAAKTRRDYKLSLALLISGIAIVVTFYSLVIFVGSTLLVFSNPAYSILFTVVGNVGYILILVGAIFAAINWSLLRQRHQDPS